MAGKHRAEDKGQSTVKVTNDEKVQAAKDGDAIGSRGTVVRDSSGNVIMGQTNKGHHDS